MTDPKADAPRKDNTARALRWSLLVIVIVASVYGWLIGRPLSPTDRRAEIDRCRAKYAQARTHGDTVRVDAFTFGGPRAQTHHTVCGDYRVSGMR